jgi:hypothetical protein
MPVAVDLGARRSEEERKVARCDKCSLTLVALKKQALSLLVQNHFRFLSFSDVIDGVDDIGFLRSHLPL